MRILKVIGINVAVVVLFWLALVASNKVTVQNWLLNSIAAVVLAALALLLALRIKARWAAMFMIVVVGYLATRLIISSVFGITAAQGAPSHFAVLLAVSLGVALGWYFFARRRPISQAV